MAIGQSNSIKIKYKLESVAGTAETTGLKVLNVTSGDVDATINTTTSTTVRSDRATSDLVRTSKTSEANIGFELRHTEFDELIAAALGGAWSTAVNFSGSIVVTVPGSVNTLTAAGIGTNIVAGHWIRFSGSPTPGNNGLRKVLTAAAGVITVGGALMTAETAAAGTIKGSSVRNGTVKPTFTVAKDHTDITQYAVSSGHVVNTMNISADSEAIVTGTFGFMGRDLVWSGSPTASDVAAGTNSIMSAAANVGSLMIDGAVPAGVYVKSLKFDTTNNARNLTAIGSLAPIDVNHGSIGATAAISTFFSDRTLLDKFISGTAVALDWSFTDDTGNSIVISFPKAKFSAGKPGGATLNADVMVDMTATAILDSTGTYMVQVSTIPA